MEYNFGDLYLVRSKGVISKLIRYFTRSKFSHGGIVAYSGLGIEATWSGVKAVRLSEEYKDSDIVFLSPKEPLSSPERRQLGRFLYARLKASNKGVEEYDFAGVLGFIFFRRWQNPKNWYCFELQYAAYEVLGRELARLDNEYIDGRTIYGSLALEVKGE